MSTSERAKMAAGEWYTCLDPELLALREQARHAVHEHNTILPSRRRNMGPALRALFAEAADDAVIEAPFHCAYGINIVVGEKVFINTGCTILDTARVHIGKSSLLGPNVQIYCAEHHKDANLRSAGLEIARPVHIGEKVWIGGGAIILGGVTLGDGAIVGAGAVVTRDVASNTTVVGNPARIRGRHPA